jgi:tetratricopeptide (TPR) repeat protein
MYEEALKHFADAYCIQSRLAIQLSALGMNEEAEAHYRRAFELMPDSFGRVESHCFGCEKAFEGERAQNIAEKVFTKFAAEHPDKPQVHYLLGYLREEQERFNEAHTNYLTAVRLDPEYLNAWVRMQSISDNVLMPAKERDEMTFNILRLDPLQHHASPGFQHVSDLTRLWDAVANAASRRSSPVSDLFALTASKIALEKKGENANEQFFQGRFMEQMQQQREGLSPAGAVAQTVFVRLAGQLILAGYGIDE